MPLAYWLFSNKHESEGSLKMSLHSNYTKDLYISLTSPTYLYVVRAFK